MKFRTALFYRYFFYPNYLCTRFSRCLSTQQDLLHLNCLLASHVRKNNLKSAFLLFDVMRSDGFHLDSYTFSSILAACTALSSDSGPIFGSQLHSLMMRSGCDKEPISTTSLLNLYSRCGCLADAVSLFYEMPNKDIVTWNSLISCYVGHGLLGDAITTVHLMTKDGLRLSSFTLCTILKACSASKSLLLGKQIHAQVAINNEQSFFIATALVDFYLSCRALNDAVEVFSRWKHLKDEALYNSFINGCFHNKHYKMAFSLLQEITPNEITLTCALSACSELSSLSYGKQIHCLMMCSGFGYDVILNNALINMYANGGDISSACHVFSQIGDKNVVSWSSIIGAYGSHGHGLKALQLFREMEKDVNPNKVTFLSVLSACAHSGLVEEGRSCFFLMRDKYGIEPGLEHYACFIDLLGRAGKVSEAWDLFNNIGNKSNELIIGVYSTLLNICKRCMDIARGGLAAKHLLDLNPNNSGSYVLLSNFYADGGGWERVEEVRKLMVSRGLNKELANSHIPL